MDPYENQLKRLDLLGGLGAGVLGAGVALLFARWLQPFAIPALLIGVVAHGWAMYRKSNLERQASIDRPKWAVGAELVCWVMLAVLFVYVGYALLR